MRNIGRGAWRTMMTDIDTALARLREMPADPRLASIDAVVLERLALRPNSRPLSGTIFGIAALAALSIGFASSLLPHEPVQTASIAPFGAPPALAPSTLLASAE